MNRYQSFALGLWLLLSLLNAVTFAGPIDSAIQKLAGPDVPAAHNWTRPISRGVIVVPVYRELYSENLGYLLESVAGQLQRHSHPVRLEVVALVNNTADVPSGYRTENQETVVFLKELAEGRMPRIRGTSGILGDAARKFLASGVRLHVLDQTTPGFVDRNIGVVRDFANHYALSILSESELDTTFIAQMDADCSLPPDYTLKVQDILSRGKWDFLLTDLRWEMERDSEPELFSRIVLDAMEFAIVSLVDTENGALPRSGSPRIVTTARTLKRLGGVPHLPSGEDTEMVRLLKESFRGNFVYNLAVTTHYRGRWDGYDAAYFLERKNHPFEFSSFARTHIARLDYIENALRSRNSSIGVLLRREYDEMVAGHESSARSLSQEIRSAVRLLRVGKAPSFTSRHGLFNTNWFAPKLNELAALYRSDDDVIAHLVRDFPHHLAVPTTQEVRLLARVQSLMRALRFEKEFPAWIGEETVRAPLNPPAIVPAPQFTPPLSPLYVNVNSSSGVISFEQSVNAGLAQRLDYNSQSIHETVFVRPNREVVLSVNSSSLNIRSNRVPLAVNSQASALVLPSTCARLVATSADSISWQ